MLLPSFSFYFHCQNVALPSVGDIISLLYTISVLLSDASCCCWPVVEFVLMYAISTPKVELTGVKRAKSIIALSLPSTVFI